VFYPLNYRENWCGGKLPRRKVGVPTEASGNYGGIPKIFNFQFSIFKSEILNLPPAAMKRLVNFAQLAIGYVGVNLRCVN